MRRDTWQQIFGTRLGTATNAYVNNKMQTISNIFSLIADDAKQKIAFNLFRYVLQVACSSYFVTVRVQKRQKISLTMSICWVHFKRHGWNRNGGAISEGNVTYNSVTTTMLRRT